MNEVEVVMEERHSHREQLVYHLRVFDAESGRVRGYVNNISPDGIMLLSEAPVSLHDTMRLNMELPEPIEGRRLIQFTAVNTWAARDERNDFYDAGFRFKSLSPEDRECIMRLICDYGLQMPCTSHGSRLSAG